MATSSHHLQLGQIYNLHNRVALVTGGGTGIGWMIAQGLAMNGVKVYITGRRKEVLEKAAQSFTKQANGGEVVP